MTAPRGPGGGDASRGGADEVNWDGLGFSSSIVTNDQSVTYGVLWDAVLRFPLTDQSYDSDRLVSP
jgi:hypothetical protein